MSNSIILLVKGKNINNFLYRLNKNNIEVFNIKYINDKEIYIEVSYKDYDTIFKFTVFFF